MKKIISTLLIALMSVLTLTACGGGLHIPDEYKYDDLTEYIDLCEYKGIGYEKTDVNVTEEEIQEEIDNALTAAASTEKKESGTVTEDCTANIDYVGSMNGKEFEGGADQGYDLDIDNSSFIDGFAEAIVGHKVGTTFDINVKFPDDYGSADLAGKPAVFKITVNYITVEKKPEYNDEFVKNNTDYDSMQAYEKSINDRLMSDKQLEADKDDMSSVFDKIMKKSKVIKYPDKEFDAKRAKLADAYKEAADKAGADVETYVSQNLGMTVDEFNEKMDEVVKESVKYELILNQIARLEGMKFTDDDYSDYIYKLLEDSGLTDETFKAQSGMTIEEYAVKNDLFTSMLYQKVMEKIMEYSKVL